jgi:phage FluMu gp28-like protein
LWFSPSYKLLLEIWRELTRILGPLTTRISSSDHRLELRGGGVIEAWSLVNPDAGRSRRYARVVIDEAAMCPTLSQSWRAAIRPTLADLRGDAWFLSTPQGRNFFWKLWCRGQDPQQPEWASWQMPTRSNPFIHPDEIEAARRELPERTFAQEFEAQFLDDSNGVFRRVRDAAVATPQETPMAGHDYVMGVDLAKTHDFTVCVVLDVSARPVRMVWMERFNQIDWTTQIERIAVLAQRYRVRKVIVDKTGVGDPVLEGLQRRLRNF